MAHKITLIPGDGIGPELTEATRRVLEATGVEFEWDVQEAGADVMDKYDGNPLPPQVLESIRANGVALKGPITTPVGKGFRSVNVALRKELDMYAQVRPGKSYEGVRSKYENVDLVIIRENTEDLYAGVEYEADSANAKELTEWVRSKGDSFRFEEHVGISIKPISEEGTRRVVKFAFEFARANGRKKVTTIHKANIMKHTDGLWLRVSEEVAKDYPEIEFEERIIDNMCMQLVQKPELYDVLVASNLYGDILSDVVAGLVGGLGMAPGSNDGDGVHVFEPVHGSAPKYAGQNKANPTAQMLSAVMMLRHLGETEAAQRMEDAIAKVIADGDKVTYDMKDDRDDPTAVGTAEFADAIIEVLASSVPA
jgi:isocitrate dehydrogenase (NAD+)